MRRRRDLFAERNLFGSERAGQSLSVRVRGDELNLAIRQFGYHRIKGVAARTAYAYNFDHGVGRTVHVGFKCLFHQLLYLHYASRDIRSAKLVNSKFNRFFLRGKFKKFRGFCVYFQQEGNFWLGVSTPFYPSSCFKQYKPLEISENPLLNHSADAL